MQEKYQLYNYTVIDKETGEILDGNAIDEEYRAVLMEVGSKVLTPKQIEYLKKLLAERKIELEITPDAKEHLAIQGYNPMYGARPLKRTIRQLIENPLSKKLLKGDFKDNAKIKIDFINDEIVFEKIS